MILCEHQDISLNYFEYVIGIAGTFQELKLGISAVN